ncbi:MULTISPECIES: AraD1 family protein [unclassified Bordetella]|uniref:AraD1 family protein n=1 Tax=unclassified Bordetella TaxID=2630031 RepID=UPI001322A73C|nr:MULTISPECIES: AraD1 family protein [unclassified Bordetella]MVW70730.1 FAH family protein [Bordetella sp. 15P40C-2]MVW77604.1 FAH family protein [Bordetella sp. 02P26C-1]
MRLIQFKQGDGVQAALVVNADTVRPIEMAGGTYALAMAAIEQEVPLTTMVEKHLGNASLSYEDLISAQRLLPPLTHPDPAHCLVSGTGLTHLGSADTRDSMHAKVAADEASLTDSMRMFKMGLEGGKPPQDQAGAQPEWFYKGDGSILVAPEQPLPVPGFAQDAGEEPELTGLYLIDKHGQPVRIGFAVGNEFSDHVTERVNYLWLAHSKLRACSFGPELLIGEPAEHLEGESRIVRDGQVIWRKPFLTGEANMAHTLANLEHHHFKYAQFRQPGAMHVHFFGTATLSFADGVVTQAGDRFEIEVPEFGRPLRNPIAPKAADPYVSVRTLS